MLAEPLSRKQYKSLGPYTTKTLHKNKQDLSYISIGDPYDRSKKDKNSRWSKSIFYFQLICTNFMLPIFNFLLDQGFSHCQRLPISFINPILTHFWQQIATIISDSINKSSFSRMSTNHHIFILTLLLHLLLYSNRRQTIFNVAFKIRTTTHESSVSKRY